MGLRSWLTSVRTVQDVKILKKAIQANDQAYGVHYVIKLTKPVPELGRPGDIIVAWSADGNWSLSNMPTAYVDRTILLDYLLDEFPAWHRGRGPAKYGRYLK